MRKGKDKPESVEDLIGEMGRERVALRARKTTAVLLVICAFMCLSVSLASFAGWLPYAPGPALVLTATAAVGFVLAVVEARTP